MRPSPRVNEPQCLTTSTTTKVKAVATARMATGTALQYPAQEKHSTHQLQGRHRASRQMLLLAMVIKTLLDLRGGHQA